MRSVIIGLSLAILALAGCQHVSSGEGADQAPGPTPSDLAARGDGPGGGGGADLGGGGGADLSGGGGLTAVPLGVWGEKDQADMTVTATGATIRFPCADGTITVPLRYDAQGAFAADGTYAAGSVARDPMPARFTGKIHGMMMDLTITLMATGKAVGSWTLIYNLKATFPICL